MKFRPCIDLHQGKVKQIVGETLGSKRVVENFVSELGAGHYAERFRKDKLTGGHVIMLGPGNEGAALEALRAYPGGLQIGGGITADNAATYIAQGASHVIVTSYVFRDGELHMDRLRKLVDKIGKERLVLDLSCKQQDGRWYVVTNQWTTFSRLEVNARTVDELSRYCDEFLIHAVDVEGKRSGMQETLIAQLAEWASHPCTYAGGVRELADIDRFERLGKGRLDLTIGSALDLFGGSLAYTDVVARCRKER